MHKTYFRYFRAWWVSFEVDDQAVSIAIATIELFKAKQARVIIVGGLQALSSGPRLRLLVKLQHQEAEQTRGQEGFQQ